MFVVLIFFTAKPLKKNARIIKLLVALSRDQIFALDLKQILHHHFSVIMLVVRIIALIRVVI